MPSLIPGAHIVKGLGQPAPLVVSEAVAVAYRLTPTDPRAGLAGSGNLRADKSRVTFSATDNVTRSRYAVEVITDEVRLTPDGIGSVVRVVSENDFAEIEQLNAGINATRDARDKDEVERYWDLRASLLLTVFTNSKPLATTIVKRTLAAAT